MTEFPVELPTDLDLDVPAPCAPGCLCQVPVQMAALQAAVDSLHDKVDLLLAREGGVDAAEVAAQVAAELHRRLAN